LNQTGSEQISREQPLNELGKYGLEEYLETKAKLLRI
jgi:hypothetical protein